MTQARDPMQARPYRLVDAGNSGWHLVAGGEYAAPEEPATWSYARILAERSPVREVVAPPDADVLLIRTALEEAGRLAAGSLAVALHRVVAAYGSSEPIVAGRPESWESAAVQWIAADTGERLNRQPQRWNADAVDVLAGVIRRWTTPQSTTYVQVAENLAIVLGQVAEAAGGWLSVSDDRMLPTWRRTGPGRGDDLDQVGALREYLLSRADLG